MINLLEAAIAPNIDALERDRNFQFFSLSEEEKQQLAEPLKQIADQFLAEMKKVAGIDIYNGEEDVLSDDLMQQIQDLTEQRADAFDKVVRKRMKKQDTPKIARAGFFLCLVARNFDASLQDLPDKIDDYL